MKFNDLKVGDAFVYEKKDCIIEGIVLKVEKYYLDSLSYISWEDGSFSFKRLCFKIDDEKEIQYANNHFCKLENLYETVKKYVQYNGIKDNYYKLLGLRVNTEKYNCVAYFKTKHMYFEITSIKKNAVPFVYIKEASSLNELNIYFDKTPYVGMNVYSCYIPEDDGLVVPVNVNKNTVAKVFQEMTFQDSLPSERNGCSFMDAKGNYLLSFITTDLFNPVTDGHFINAMEMIPCKSSEFLSELERMDKRFLY